MGIGHALETEWVAAANQRATVEREAHLETLSKASENGYGRMQRLAIFASFASLL